MNWDDLKLLLAIGRAGSISGASRDLRVHRATVLRRFDAMEARLGARLCDRTPEGYALTPSGSRLFELAEQTERGVLAAEAEVAGEDERVEGVVRVTMPEPVANWLIAPRLAEFQRRWPGLVLEILATMDLMDLSRRDADIALRITIDPLETLVGRRFGMMAQTVYGREDALERLMAAPRPVIGWTGPGPLWTERFGWEEVELVGASAEISVQIAMAMTGAGLCCLPCFVGDQSPDLVRAGAPVFQTPHELWLLTHPDLRRQARIDAAMRFLSEVLSEAKPLFEGEVQAG
ncbi:MAG: LysR family transcriptional regulator [Pseudomonadota bacterium]